MEWYRVGLLINTLDRTKYFLGGISFQDVNQTGIIPIYTLNYYNDQSYEVFFLLTRNFLLV